MTWIGTLALALRISVIIRLTLLGLSSFITNMEIIYGDNNNNLSKCSKKMLALSKSNPVRKSQNMI